MAKLSIAESNELWFEYSKWLKNNNEPPINNPYIEIHNDYSLGWEPGEREAMEAVRQLAIAGSSQCEDWW